MLPGVRSVFLSCQVISEHMGANGYVRIVNVIGSGRILPGRDPRPERRTVHAVSVGVPGAHAARAAWRPIRYPNTIAGPSVVPGPG